MPFLIAALGAFCLILSTLIVILFLWGRSMQKELLVNPFELEIGKLTAKITVKREGKKIPIQVSLLQLLDVISVEGRSLQHMADDLSKVLGLEDDKITESEMRIILLYVSPSLVDFSSSLKKALPYG